MGTTRKNLERTSVQHFIMGAYAPARARCGEWAWPSLTRVVTKTVGCGTLGGCAAAVPRCRALATVPLWLARWWARTLPRVAKS